eukprot:gene1253-45_t
MELPPDNRDEAAAEARGQIYALNRLLSAQSEALWVAYRESMRRRLVALSCCLEHGERVIVRRGLRQLRMCIDTVGTDAQWREHEGVSDFARRARLAPVDEAMLRAMPIDATSGVRFCPWASTADGCPWPDCPWSHAPLLAPTWKYRYWALERHNGWVGESQPAVVD